ncbi:MAG: carboxymuconolactone decarboxylase family protein [Gammaproteobacteria bacterium]|nr:carboxymuconolactone decarboxylase family protein [Gammaproteobacteria bacterium]
MRTLTLHTAESAPADSRNNLGKVKNGLGFIPNVFAAIAESPKALDAFVGLNNSYQKSIFTDVERQVILLATSTENRCVYCVAGHTAFAASLGIDESVVEAMRNFQSLTDIRLDAINKLVRALVNSRGQVKKELDDFFRAGYSQQHFFELVLGVCLKTFSNYVSNALSIPLDEGFQPYAWERPERPLQAA